MDGVAIMMAILLGDSGVTALVPAAKIVAGDLSQGIVLDAISITKVSSNDRNILQPTDKRRVMERVQVTALASTYPRMKAIIHAVRAAAADFIGNSTTGATEVDIHTDVGGPDFMDDNSSIHMSSQDFIVGFNEPT
jgi:hypothetical protein